MEIVSGANICYQCEVKHKTNGPINYFDDWQIISYRRCVGWCSTHSGHRNSTEIIDTAANSFWEGYQNSIYVIHTRIFLKRALSLGGSGSFEGMLKVSSQTLLVTKQQLNLLNSSFINNIIYLWIPLVFD